MKRFQVLLTGHAVRDLDEILDYLASHESAARAGQVLDRIEGAFRGLATFPERGAHPQELLALGIREYRQILSKPYRVMYRIVERRVYVYLIADGRRDMQALLARRLLEM